MKIVNIPSKELPCCPQSDNYKYYQIEIDNYNCFWAAVKISIDKKVISLLSIDADGPCKAGILPFPCEAYDLSSLLEDNLHDFYKKHVEIKEYSEDDEYDALAGYYSNFDY